MVEATDQGDRTRRNRRLFYVIVIAAVLATILGLATADKHLPYASRSRAMRSIASSNLPTRRKTLQSGARIFRCSTTTTAGR